MPGVMMITVIIVMAFVYRPVISLPRNIAGKKNVFIGEAWNLTNIERILEEEKAHTQTHTHTERHTHTHTLPIKKIDKNILELCLFMC